MSTITKLTWIETKLYGREPFSLVFTFVFPLALLMVLAGVFGSDPNAEGFEGLVPSDYYLAGYVAVVIGAIGLIAVPVHVATYRERGILKRFRAASIPPAAALGAQVVVGLVTATVGAVVLVLVGRLLYDTALPDQWAAAGLSFVVASLAFLAVGFLIGSLVPTARSAQAVGMVLFFPMWLLSGAAAPPSQMSDGMTAIADVLPLTFAVRSMQDAWLGSGLRGGDVLLLAAVLGVAAVASLWTLRRT